MIQPYLTVLLHWMIGEILGIFDFVTEKWNTIATNVQIWKKLKRSIPWAFELSAVVMLHPLHKQKTRTSSWLGKSSDYLFLVGESGFEPLKRDATDLQSAPFGHSGTLPYLIFLPSKINGAGGRTRTPDLLITNQLLYQLSYTSTLWPCRLTQAVL